MAHGYGYRSSSPSTTTPRRPPANTPVIFSPFRISLYYFLPSPLAVTGEFHASPLESVGREVHKIPEGTRAKETSTHLFVILSSDILSLSLSFQRDRLDVVSRILYFREKKRKRKGGRSASFSRVSNFKTNFNGTKVTVSATSRAHPLSQIYEVGSTYLPLEDTALSFAVVKPPLLF